MLNHEIYMVNPASRKIVNEGVASVNDDQQRVLRYELDTFVCDGQYENGLEHILEVYLGNLNQEQQPGVWVSGFFGSGKSHLVKMLAAFWTDRVFDDGATARGIATLPESVKIKLVELTNAGKRFGGLHAALGTLGAGAGGSVRLSLLRIIFKSAGLPEQYPQARFVLWLKKEGIFDAVRAFVENQGDNWSEELDNLYVSGILHAAVAAAKPKLYDSPAACGVAINNEYHPVTDVSVDEMVKAIRSALSSNGQFPLTLVALDEVQQYIGSDEQRSLDVQETVEACCKMIGSRMLFIGTGQTAVTGTPHLKKLEGRFTVRIELSDTDVDAVVRKVILAKRPDAIDALKQVMQQNNGEIARQLSGTSIGYRGQDADWFTQDYPILPVRRRFWEHTLRVLDPTGTDSQLRNQLTMVHRAAQSHLMQPIGNVIAGDYLYCDLADKLLQSRTLPRNVHEKTIKWNAMGGDDQLKARACALVFLINRLSDTNKEVGIKATAETLADLMVTDLAAGSTSLRSTLPALLDKCDLLIKIGDEYRIQTPESMAWRDEFEKQRGILSNETHRISAEREDRIRQKFSEAVGKLSFSHGQSNISRDISPVFEETMPAAKDKVVLWIRSGWSAEESEVQVAAKQAGNDSPLILAYIPKRSADELRDQIKEYKAAVLTLGIKGTPTSVEGKEAQSAMNTRRDNANARIQAILSEAIAVARVFQAGGAEVLGAKLRDAVMAAAENALKRLYPNFLVGDHAEWGKVYSLAHDGSPDPLKAVGYSGDPALHPVCKAILGYLAAGKSGADIRSKFEGDQYGWSRDTVDGVLLTLVVGGQIKCIDEQGRVVDLKKIERKQISKLSFRPETVVLQTSQRLKVRQLFLKLAVQAESEKESEKAGEFLDKLKALGEQAGGEAPRPHQPVLSLISELKLKIGNEQLFALFEQFDALSKRIEAWKVLKDAIDERLPGWNKLQSLLQAAGEASCVSPIRQQADAILANRLLLQEPDMVQPLIKSLEDVLRSQLLEYQAKYKAGFESGMANLEKSSAWQGLTPQRRSEILVACGIAANNGLSCSNYAELQSALKQYPLTSWSDRVEALKHRFAKALEQAVKEMEPTVQLLEIPKRTLKTDADIDHWLQEVGEQLRIAVKAGPVNMR